MVVFDMDDTLYLERDYVRSGFAAVGSTLELKYDVHGFAPRAWRAFLNGTRGNTFNLVLGEILGAEGSELVGECIDIYRNHSPDIALLEDARDMLQYVGSRFRTALITDGPASSQSAKAMALDLYRTLDRVILTDEFGAAAGKPSPLTFRALQEEFGISGDQCIYIGDNPAKDFAAPVALGWATWRVRRPLSLHQLIETDNPATVTTRGLDPSEDFRLNLLFGAP
ncbi:HAD family hydrolase [Arthrobacter sp. RT-1]|nr:HAD family hydrolase [Arthrobacter sp. RT-1]